MHIIDNVERTLCMEFPEEELDFIINYCMGDELNEE